MKQNRDFLNLIDKPEDGTTVVTQVIQFPKTVIAVIMSIRRVLCHNDGRPSSLPVTGGGNDAASRDDGWPDATGVYGVCEGYGE